MDVPDESRKSSRPTNLPEHHVSSPSEHIIPQMVVTSADDASDEQKNITECTLVLIPPSNGHSSDKDTSAGFTESANSVQEERPVDDFEDISVIVRDVVSKCTEFTHSVRQRPLVIEVEKNVQSQETGKDSTSIKCPPPPPPVTAPCVVMQPPPPPPPVLVNEPQPPPPSTTPSSTPVSVCSAPSAMQRPLVFDGAASKAEPVLELQKDASLEETTEIKGKLICDKIIQEIQHTSEVPVEEVRISEECTTPKKEGLHGVKKFFDSLWNPEAQEAINLSESGISKESTVSSDVPTSGKRVKRISQSSKDSKSDLTPSPEPPCETKESTSFAKDAKQNIKSFFGSLKHETGEVKDSSKRQSKEFEPEKTVPDSPKESSSFTKDTKKNIKALFDTFKAEPSEQNKTSPVDLNSEIPADKNLPSTPESPKESTSFAKDAKENIKAFFDTFKHDSSEQKPKSDIGKKSLSQPNVGQESDSENILHLVTPESAKEPKESKSILKDIKQSIKVKSSSTKKSLSQPEVDKDFNAEVNLQSSETESPKESSFAKDTKQNIKSFFDTFKHESNDSKHKKDVCKKSASHPDFTRDSNEIDSPLSQSPKEKESVSFAKEAKQNVKAFFDTFKHETAVSKSEDSQKKSADSQPPTFVLNKDSEIPEPIELNKESVSASKDTKQGNKSFFGSFKHESGNLKTKSDSSKKPTASEPDLHIEAANEKVVHEKDTKNPIKKFFSFKHIGEGETISPELSGSLDSQLPKESGKTAPIKIPKSVRLDLRPTYSNGAENLSASYTHMNGHEAESISNVKERAQSVPSDAFRKSDNFVITDMKKSEDSSVVSLDSPPGKLGEHKEGRHSIKKFFDSFKHEKTCAEKDSSLAISKKESSKELSAIDLASGTDRSEKPVKEKKNKSIKRSFSDKLNREEVMQNFKGFFDSVGHKAPSKKSAEDSEHIYDVVEVKSEVDSSRSVVLKTDKADAKTKGTVKSENKGLKKMLSPFHHKDASKTGSENINVTQSKTDKTEENLSKGKDLQKPLESTKLSSHEAKVLKDEAISELPPTTKSEPSSPKQDRTSVFNTIGENIIALKDKMLHSKEKRKSELIDDSTKVTDLSPETGKRPIEISLEAALPSTSKESIKENVITTKPVPPEKPKLILPEKPKEIPPEKPKQIPPERPKQIPPEKPKQIAPEKPKQIAPEKPKQIVPEKPKQIAPEKPKEIKEAGKPTIPQAIKKSEPLREANNTKPSTLYDSCCMKIAVLLRDKALDIVDRTKSPPPKPPKPSAETIAKARAAAVTRRLADAQKKGLSVGECFPLRCDGMRFVDDDTESSCDYKDVENFDYIMDYELINRYKLDSNKLDTFSLPSTCSGLTSYYTADTVTSRDEIYADAVMETVSLSSDISYNLNKFSSSKSKPKIYPGDMKGRKEAATTKQSTPKKLPPPIPPKPIISKIKEKTDDKTVSQCVNGLSLSPRLQNKISKDPVATQKRPLMVADIKGTQFSSLQHPKKNAPQKPARNFDTILKNESLKKVPFVSLDSIGTENEKTMKSDNLSKSIIKVDKRTMSPPRPPPPNITKKPEKLPKPERPPPPIKSPKSLPAVAKENLEEVSTLSDVKHSEEEVQNLSIVSDQGEKDQDSTLIIDKDKSEDTLDSHSVVDTEKSQSTGITSDDSYQYNLKIEQDSLNNNFEPDKAIIDSLNNNIEACKDVPIENPKPPPRNRRIRSRTVEVVPPEKEEDRLKRSQSLSEIDVQKRVTFLDAEKAKVDSKSLYTTVNKNGKKSNSEKTSQSSPDLSFRPLPAPPPPPRRFRSLERKTKSKSKEQIDDKFIKTHELSVSPAPSEDSIKAPSRRKKTDKQRFFSLHDDQIREIDMVSNNFKRAESVPSRPDRKIKSSMTTKYDVNANISSVNSSQDSLFTGKNIPNADTTDSVGKSKSKKDADSRKRSLSNWYDEQDQGSWEVINVSHELAEEIKQSPKVPQRHKVETKRKSRETSKFYVNVDEEATTLSVDEASSPTPYINKPVSPVPLVDKETSPLPLDCSEKSVQTSLETLSQGIASRDEQSDDTDELLDLAQTLQKELSVIINRHKSVNESTEDTPSPPLSAATSEKNLAQDFKEIKKISSVRSSTSEVWPITSSDESDVERVGEDSSNINEVAVKRKQKKIFYIAREIMTSEEAFVDALKLLNVDFKTAVETANRQRNMTIIPEDNLAQILNHLPQLQHLNENLLMELKDRIENWDKHEKIADIIVKMGPFLKLYSWYIHDFESNVSLLEECKKKFPAFCHVVKEFEASARCKRLALNHYMLKPIQRIPQYRLLLQEYLHHLSENSKDYQDTVAALQIVSEVANHANDSMKHGDNAQKLISIQNSIMGHKEIVKPGRIFVKEGELMKLSRKGMQPRWFVLFNDLLLYLTSVQQGLYRVNHELPLTGMKVAIPIQQDYQNEFSIISVTRSFTLAARSPEERQEWIIALTKAIEENASKRSTFTNSRLNQKAQDKTSSEDEAAFVLGKKAPVWIPDARVTMCQLCTSEFTVTFRRHHCRACGKVVCSICSSHRISLPYLGNRIARVCDECHIHLGQGSSACTESGETDSENQQIAIKPHLRTDNRHVKKNKRMLPSVLKEVCANDQGSTISGYLHKRTAKSWKRDWFVVKDKVLYEYKASEDVAALRSIPLLGYQIELFDEACDGVDSSLLFQLTHPGQAPIVFYADTIGSAESMYRKPGYFASMIEKDFSPSGVHWTTPKIKEYIH